jgi:flagellar biogenesis protein FliO
MPPLVKCLGLVLVVAWPGGLTATATAQTPAPIDANVRRPETSLSPGIAPFDARNQAQPQPPPPPLPRHDAPIPLAPPGHAGPSETTKPVQGLPALGPMASGLAIVLGLFLAVAWALRRTAPKGTMLLPGEVVEVLGRAPLAGRQQMHLLRCGNKLLLVSVTPAGAETLTEVTEPAEVDRLAGLCRQAHPRSATTAFRQIFQQFGAGSEDRNA